MQTRYFAFMLNDDSAIIKEVRIKRFWKQFTNMKKFLHQPPILFKRYRIYQFMQCSYRTCLGKSNVLNTFDIFFYNLIYAYVLEYI